jgi:hypothetical protein
VPPRRLIREWLKEGLDKDKVRKRMICWSIERSQVSRTQLNKEQLTCAELEAVSACMEVS